MRSLITTGTGRVPIPARPDKGPKPPMTPVLEVKDLVKDYPGIRALDGISFAIPRGTCFGLLGPNGAGKTTAIEIAEGIIPATSGEVLYKGLERDGNFREEVGIQFQTTSLLSFLTIRETLETFRKLYRHPRSLKDLIRFCHLEEILEKRNDKVSGGQRQRLLLAMALVNDPELIFMDEPTTGLDPHARRHLWEIVETIKSEGKTIVLTTHYMEEAEVLCDTIAIVDKGRIIARGTPRQLLAEHCADVRIRLPKGSLPSDAASMLDSLTQSGAVHEVQKGDDGYVTLITGHSDAVLETLLTHGADLSDISVQQQKLEDLFLRLTGSRPRN